LADSRPLELTGFSGSLTSVNYPSNYENSADCQWLIRSVEENGLVTLDFSYFQTEACCDFVYIYDGDSTKSPLVRTLNGKFDPPPSRIISSQRSLFIRFTSDPTDTDVGFAATFTTSASGTACSSASQPLRLTSYTGLFVSLNYPFSYDGNSDCRWLITSPETYAIVNLIFDEFDTESCCDIVYIYNGNTIKSPLITALSGSAPVLSGGYNSTQRNMLVRFVSDDTVSSVGFRATFSSLRPGNPCSSGSPLDLAEYNGSFSSTNYPGNYTDGSDCQWRLTAIEGNGIITLTFADFSLEACCDFMTIYDGDSTKSPLIASISGTLPAGTQYTSTQRYMFVRFASDPSVSDKGFSANYVSSVQGSPCSALDQPVDLTGYVGVFTSVNYPNDYENGGNCQWRITAAVADQVVMVDFTEFTTESCCDFLTLYDGNNPKAAMLRTLSGVLSPPPRGIRSTQVCMYIKFVSDAAYTDRGFSATFASV